MSEIENQCHIPETECQNKNKFYENKIIIKFQLNNVTL